MDMARLPRPLCLKDLRSGRLQRMLEHHFPDPITVHLAYPSRRSLTAAGRPFLEWLDEDVAQIIASFGEAAV